VLGAFDLAEEDAPLHPLALAGDGALIENACFHRGRHAQRQPQPHRLAVKAAIRAGEVVGQVAGAGRTSYSPAGNAASSTRATRWSPSRLVGNSFQVPEPAGLISMTPLPRPDMRSVTRTDTRVGSALFCDRSANSPAECLG
jgi:hypothetical protein